MISVFLSEREVCSKHGFVPRDAPYYHSRCICCTVNGNFSFCIIFNCSDPLPDILYFLWVSLECH